MRLEGGAFATGARGAQMRQMAGLQAHVSGTVGAAPAGTQEKKQRSGRHDAEVRTMPWIAEEW